MWDNRSHDSLRLPTVGVPLVLGGHVNLNIAAVRGVCVHHHSSTITGGKGIRTPSKALSPTIDEPPSPLAIDFTNGWSSAYEIETPDAASMSEVAEGVATAGAVIALAQKSKKCKYGKDIVVLSPQMKITSGSHSVISRKRQMTLQQLRTKHRKLASDHGTTAILWKRARANWR
ncbi:hypothetical protein L1887_28916 [Cichorium endivia]|nr:hypothetical protein L1887_28916 [Cichorium endivia]